jgi:LacI family transcriptional regulator
MALRSLIERGVSALATSSDYIAMKVLREAESAGIEIPGQLSVTGFDNNPMSGETSPPLTTVAVDRYETGRQMALALVEQHRNPGNDMKYQYKMPVRLVVRQSTNTKNNSVLMDHFACGTGS